MNALYALIAVAVLLGVACAGAGPQDQRYLLGVIIPYVAIAVFIVGVIYRILKWASAPVPFRIPTVCGQQKSLRWIRSSTFESPHNTLGVIGRMALEVLLFRSLFRNTKMTLTPAKRLAYGSSKYLWLGALAFHWSFLVILLRHMRFFLEPTPGFVHIVESWDGLIQFTAPTFFLTDAVIVGALLYLLARRIASPLLRYLSLPADYFALFVLLGVVISGISMRYFTKVDLVTVKQLCLSLVTLQPVLPEGLGMPFLIHVFFVSVLLAYFPFSKMMHMGGVFLSPTRNLANNNRMRRHINPWNAPVGVHTYQEWEEEFGDKLKACGYALDRE